MEQIMMLKGDLNPALQITL